MVFINLSEAGKGSVPTIDWKAIASSFRVMDKVVAASAVIPGENDFFQRRPEEQKIYLKNKPKHPIKFSKQEQAQIKGAAIKDTFVGS